MAPKDEGRCPLCAEPLYAWATLPGEDGGASVGQRVSPEAGIRVLDRCESCGVVVERGREPDLAVELDVISRADPDGSLVIECANRSSLQGLVGGSAWAPLDRLPGRLALTPRSLALLAERNGRRLVDTAFPPTGRNAAWMWQTILNAFTFHNNFARDAWARRLRPSGGRGRAAFAIDALVSVLATPLVVLVSVPLEAIAALARRGGRIVAVAEPAERQPAGADAPLRWPAARCS